MSKHRPLQAPLIMLMLMASVDSINAKYAQAEASVGRDIYVRFQYGQGKSNNEEYIMTADAKTKKFRSAADLLNFLERNGWEHEEVMLAGFGNGSSLFFILKKKN